MLLVRGLSQSCSQTGGWRWRFNLKSWLEGLPLQAPVCGCWGRLQLFKQADDRLRAQFLGDWLFPPGTSPPAWVTLERVRERYQDSAIIFLQCNLTSHIPPFLPYSNSLEASISTTHIQEVGHTHECERQEVNRWKVVAEPQKMLGFLASGREEFNLGPGTGLDHSELLCNKVLLKHKGERESFWHRHQKGAERIPTC